MPLTCLNVATSLSPSYQVTNRAVTAGRQLGRNCISLLEHDFDNHDVLITIYPAVGNAKLTLFR